MPFMLVSSENSITKTWTNLSKLVVAAILQNRLSRFTYLVVSMLVLQLINNRRN